ncbi:MAG: 2-isopropylmalate synthase, partial [Amylibacter sp.]
MGLAPAPLLAQTEQIVTKQYDTGGIYEGTFKDGKQHGTGSYSLPNGYEYKGQWVDGEIQGPGVAKVPNGS